MEDKIRRRAYELWEADGCPEGQDQAYWFKAMSEIASAAMASVAKPARKRTPKPKAAKAA